MLGPNLATPHPLPTVLQKAKTESRNIIVKKTKLCCIWGKRKMKTGDIVTVFKCMDKDYNRREKHKSDHEITVFHKDQRISCPSQNFAFIPKNVDIMMLTSLIKMSKSEGNKGQKLSQSVLNIIKDLADR